MTPLTRPSGSREFPYYVRPSNSRQDIQPTTSSSAHCSPAWSLLVQLQLDYSDSVLLEWPLPEGYNTP